MHLPELTGYHQGTTENMFNYPVTKRQKLKAMDWARKHKDSFSVSQMQRELKFKIPQAWTIANILEERGKIGPMVINGHRKVYL